jgi:hypothetical protein
MSLPVPYWKIVEQDPPPESVEVDTAIIDSGGIRMQHTLVRYANLWFLPGTSMYVYYTPTHWREKQSS